MSARAMVTLAHRARAHVTAAFAIVLLAVPCARATPTISAGMNETVVMIPADASGDTQLETTLFKPDGPGPFPVVVFNHGRDAGDPHLQPRSRPLAFAREFVRRGYLVAVPNRRGFAASTGTYPDTGCDVEADGDAQARDIRATIEWLARSRAVDASRIVVAGVSHGGFAALAYGASAAPGVRGIVNFSGGLRKDQCVQWQGALTQAFRDYGARSHLPTLWFYGSNDRVFDHALVATLDRVYTEAGGRATLIDYGRYKDDAHGLVGDRDAVPVWWPAMSQFLTAIDMPVAIAFQVDASRDAARPSRASGFAKLEAVDAVPFIDDAGRIGYLSFLGQAKPRVFAISRSGHWAWAAGGDDPFAEAIDNCSQKSVTPCKIYAIDDIVVWRPN